MCHFFVPSTHNTVSIDWLKNEINKKKMKFMLLILLPCNLEETFQVNGNVSAWDFTLDGRS